MATIEIPRNYEQGAILLEADLDAIQDALETFFNTTKINDDNILSQSITGSDKLIDSTVVTATFADETLEAQNFASSAVTTAKLADLAVTTAKINDSAVTTAKIDNSAVTTDKIAALNVTAAKLVDASTISSSSGTISTSTTSAPGADISLTNMSVTLQTYGRPVMLVVNGISTSTSSPSRLDYIARQAACTAGVSNTITDQTFNLYLYKDASLLATWSCNLTASSIAANIRPAAQVDTLIGCATGAFTYIDDPGVTGSTTYELKLNYGNSNPSPDYSSASVDFRSIKLIAVEI